MHLGEEPASLTGGDGKSDIQLENKETRFPSFTPHKNQPQMDQKLSGETWSPEAVRRTGQENTLRHRNRWRFPDQDSAHSENKASNQQVGLHEIKKLLYSKKQLMRWQDGLHAGKKYLPAVQPAGLICMKNPKSKQEIKYLVDTWANEWTVLKRWNTKASVKSQPRNANQS